jgi:hypothetical protein
LKVCGRVDDNECQQWWNDTDREDKVDPVTYNVTLARWRNHCYRQATVRSVIVGLPVTFSGIKISIVAKSGFMGNLCPRQEKVLTSSCEVSDIFCLILTKFGVCRQIFVTVPSMKIAWEPC